jgi:hypothetical protein
MGQLNRTMLLSKEPLKIEKVEFENGDFVFVTEMTGHAKDSFEQSLIKKVRDKKGQITGFEQMTEEFRAKLAVCTICDEKGVLIFDKEDFFELSANIGAKKLEKIVDAASKLNSITEADKDILVKNSEADLEDSSSSGSAKK